MVALQPSILIGILVEPLEHLLLVLVVPLLVGLLDFFLHVVERVLEHLGELLTHLVDAAA